MRCLKKLTGMLKEGNLEPGVFEDHMQDVFKDEGERSKASTVQEIFLFE